jgi:hypothetical protein
MPTLTRKGMQEKYGLRVSKQVWESVSEHVLPKAPSEEEAKFFPWALRLSLSGRPDPGKLKKVWDVVLDDVLPNVPKEQCNAFFETALPASLSNKPSAESLRGIWRTILDDVLPNVPKRHQKGFFRKALPELLGQNPSLQDLQRAGRLIRVHGYVPLYVNALASSPPSNWEHFLNPKALPKRIPLKKTGSELDVLGGANTGIIVRTISKSAYDAWRKAEDAGISVEPIIKGRTGRRKVYPSRNGGVRVYSRYSGEDLTNFALHPDYPRYRQQINRQCEKINAALKREGIRHGHPHMGNFTVEIVKNKPVVRLIDLDQARVS